jgi:hypothetical protein
VPAVKANPTPSQRPKNPRRRRLLGSDREPNGYVVNDTPGVGERGESWGTRNVSTAGLRFT